MRRVDGPVVDTEYEGCAFHKDPFRVPDGRLCRMRGKNYHGTRLYGVYSDNMFTEIFATSIWGYSDLQRGAQSRLTEGDLDFLTDKQWKEALGS